MRRTGDEESASSREEHGRACALPADAGSARSTRPHEVCLLVGRGDAVLWADLTGGPSRLPDRRARWDAVWAHRADLTEIAHSHPHGPLAFSQEDLTTMRALDAALGRPLAYTVVTPDGVLRRPGGTKNAAPVVLTTAPWWAGLLRAASAMTDSTAPGAEESPCVRP